MLKAIKCLAISILFITLSNVKSMKKQDMNEILKILMKKQSIPMSWGMTDVYYDEVSVRFTVNGFKFKGDVMVIAANAQFSKFNVFYLKDNKVVNEVKGVKAKNLVDTIDKYVELVDNYDEVRNQWAIQEISKIAGFDVSGLKDIIIV